jgi:hypothetical protein
MTERFGFACAGVGDVNGDGYGDVLIGAPWFTDERGEVGCFCLFFGGPHGLSGPVQRLVGESPEEGFGFVCAGLGDVNGDGFADVAIGAPDHDGRAKGAGEVRVFLGGPRGLIPNPAWRAEGWSSGSDFGRRVTTGDVDGDGHRDLIVGAGKFSRSKNDVACGAIYVYRGTGRTPPFEREPTWWTTPDQPQAQFGNSLAVGDVNRDGADDILVTSPRWRSGPVLASRQYLYLGVPKERSPRPRSAR